MFRFNLDRFYDDNPQDAVGGTNAPSVARRYSRRSWTTQMNHTAVLSAETVERGAVRVAERRSGDEVGGGDARRRRTRGRDRCRSRWAVAAVGPVRPSGAVFGHADVVARAAPSAIRREHHAPYVGGHGSEPGTAVLGTFTFRNTTTAPFDQLTLADVQQYTQPINFGIDRYELSQWLYTGFVQDSMHVRRDLTIDLGLRYDRQTLTDAKKNFAPRVGFGWHPGGDARVVDPRRLRDVLHADPVEPDRRASW